MQTVDAGGLQIGDDHPPRIMGVLNVSNESPYSPSVYDDPAEASAYVDDELIGEGADIVDIGLESANKRLDVLSAEQELDRLDTAVETIESVSGDAVFSIETRYAEVADAALARGFDMVNDICGFADPEMPEVCREYDVAVCKMASPPDLTKPGAVEETDWTSVKSPAWVDDADYVDQLYEALKQNGLTEKTIVDPAFGGWSEAKTLEDDRETFRRLGEFRGLGLPILVSINRKNFLRKLDDRSTESALPVSLAATSLAVERGAHVIRTHDVWETRNAALVGDAFTERDYYESEDVSVTELDLPRESAVERHLERIGAPTDDSGEFVTSVFEITGLNTDEMGELADAAAETGLTVRVGDNGILVSGDTATLQATASKLPFCDRFGPLDDSFRGE